ncbi:hypothetical protein ACMFWY_26425, partial [Roseiconus sp. JC912]|uniref:hypothetical protein n=1 Tax=Roseiconus sp. JC912 TaxID=3396307 RepID=UPI003A4C68CE
ISEAGKIGPASVAVNLSSREFQNCFLKLSVSSGEGQASAFSRVRGGKDRDFLVEVNSILEDSRKYFAVVSSLRYGDCCSIGFRYRGVHREA